MRCDCKIVKKKRSVRKRLLIAMLIIAAAVVAVIVFITGNVNPMIVAISNEKIKAIAADAVGSAVIDIMSGHSDTEFVSVDRDGNGKIRSVEIDSSAISTLAQDITLAAQKNINMIGQDGIKIPVGSLSGVTLFTGLGPDINIKIYLVGSTQTKITSVFSSSGINQTLHSVYLTLTGSVSVAVPGLPSTIKTTTQVLMSEMIIIGEVPPTYLNAATIGDMLDLVVDR